MIQPSNASLPRTDAQPSSRSSRSTSSAREIATGALKCAVAALAVFAPGAAAAGRPGTLGALAVPGRRLLDTNVNCIDTGESYSTGSAGNVNYNSNCGGSSAASIAANLGNGGNGGNVNFNG